MNPLNLVMKRNGAGKQGILISRVMLFLFDENSRNEETAFEVFYVDNSEDTGKTYQYGFSLKKVRDWFLKNEIVNFGDSARC